MPNVESYGWKTVLSPKLLTIVEQNVTASNILIVPEYLSKVLFENVIYKYHHNIIDKLIVVRDNKQKLNSKWLHALKCESWDKINCTLPTLLCPTCFSPMKHSRNSKMKTIPITSNKKMKGINTTQDASQTRVWKISAVSESKISEEKQLFISKLKKTNNVKELMELLTMYTASTAQGGSHTIYIIELSANEKIVVRIKRTPIELEETTFTSVNTFEIEDKIVNSVIVGKFQLNLVNRYVAANLQTELDIHMKMADHELAPAIEYVGISPENNISQQYVSFFYLMEAKGEELQNIFKKKVGFHNITVQNYETQASSIINELKIKLIRLADVLYDNNIFCWDLKPENTLIRNNNIFFIDFEAGFCMVRPWTNFKDLCKSHNIKHCKEYFRCIVFFIYIANAWVLNSEISKRLLMDTTVQKLLKHTDFTQRDLGYFFNTFRNTTSLFTRYTDMHWQDVYREIYTYSDLEAKIWTTETDSSGWKQEKIASWFEKIQDIKSTHALNSIIYPFLTRSIHSKNSESKIITFLKQQHYILMRIKNSMKASLEKKNIRHVLNHDNGLRTDLESKEIIPKCLYYGCYQASTTMFSCFEIMKIKGTNFDSFFYTMSKKEGQKLGEISDGFQKSLLQQLNIIAALVYNNNIFCLDIKVKNSYIYRTDTGNLEIRFINFGIDNNSFDIKQFVKQESLHTKQNWNIQNFIKVILYLLIFATMEQMLEYSRRPEFTKKVISHTLSHMKLVMLSFETIGKERLKRFLDYINIKYIPSELLYTWRSDITKTYYDIYLPGEKYTSESEWEFFAS